MWVARIRIDSWNCVDFVEKVIIVPMPSVRAMVRIVSCHFGLVDMSQLLGKLVVIEKRC